MAKESKYAKLAERKTVEKAIAGLKARGIEAVFVESGEEAKRKVLEMVPQGAEAFTSSSTTLDTIGLPKEINEGGKYNSVRAKLNSMDRKTQSLEMRKLGAAPEWVVGSVHAVTQKGEVVVASNTGSQLPAYSYGADHVIFVVGTQKIVKNMDGAMERLYKYVLPLESERAHKAYGVPGSAVNKMLVINREVTPGRITLIFVNEKLGF